MSALCKLCAILDRLYSETVGCITEKLFTFSLLYRHCSTRDQNCHTDIQPYFEERVGKLYNRGALQNVHVNLEPTHIIYITYLYCIMLLHVQTGTENDLQLANMLDNWWESRRKLFEVLNNSQQFIPVAFCKTFIYMNCLAKFLTESNLIASRREKPAGYKEG